MIRSTPFLAAAALLLAAPSAITAQQAAPTLSGAITAREIDGHLRFLSHDLLEGRAPATRGGELAAQYIASQLRAFAVEPAGVGGSYFQRVPIDVVAADSATLRVSAGAGQSESAARFALRYPQDVVVWAGSATDASAARGELVFVGYGS